MPHGMGDDMNGSTAPAREVTTGRTTQLTQERGRQTLGLRRGLGYGPRSESRQDCDGR